MELKDKKHSLTQLARGWSLTHNEKHLTRRLEFETFESTMKFVNEVARIAKEQNHHPQMTLGKNFCEIEIWTFTEGDLTEKDFLFAKEVDGVPI